MTSEDKKVKELEYFSATGFRRFTAFIIDFFIVVSFAGLIAFLTNLVVNATPSYKYYVDYRHSYQVDSGFYTNDYQLITYDLENSDKNILERAQTLDSKIDNYYINILKNNGVLEGYWARKGSSILFKYNPETKNYDYNSTDYEKIYNWFKDEIYSYTLGCFMSDSTYNFGTKLIFIMIVVDVIIGLLISSAIFMLLLPLTIFKRGRCTLGLKFMKIGLIDNNALNVPVGKFIGRYFFIYFVEMVMSLFSFLLPAFVSVGFALISKNKQNLHNYIFGVYLVDVSTAEIYLNYEDYLDRKGLAEAARLENKDFTIK